MEEKNLLSIIVPVYNMIADGKLEFCMRSLLNQELDSYEILAVDDGSTDNSLEYLRRLERENPKRLRVIASPENRRQGGAKNLGLGSASGQWLGFVDSDDWIAPDMYRKLLEKAGETGADIVACDYCMKDRQDFVREKAEKNHVPEQTGELTKEKRKLLFLEPGSMVIKIYRRELFLEHGLRFPEKMFYEDNCLGVYPFVYAKRFELVPEALYYYYQHSASTVHHISAERCRDRMRAMELYLEEGKERGVYGDYRDEMDYKVFELGYKNTLFSYLHSEKRPDPAFLKELSQFLKRHVPRLKENPYYLQYTDAEERRLISLHLKSGFLLAVYYRLLHFYRRIRYGNP